MKYLLTAAFVAVVYLANWTLERYGFVDLIGPGTIIVPAGVYWAGLSFGLRDALHETGGRWWVIGAILAGSALSYLQSDGATIPGGHVSIAVASGVAFLLAEFADYAVYAPMRERQWSVAVIASNVVGSAVDSLLFLWLAFGATAGWIDLTYGKALMIVPALLLVGAIRWQHRPQPRAVHLTDKVIGDS